MHASMPRCVSNEPAAPACCRLRAPCSHACPVVVRTAPRWKARRTGSFVPLAPSSCPPSSPSPGPAPNTDTCPGACLGCPITPPGAATNTCRCHMPSKAPCSTFPHGSFLDHAAPASARRRPLLHRRTARTGQRPYSHCFLNPKAYGTRHASSKRGDPWLACTVPHTTRRHCSIPGNSEACSAMHHPPPPPPPAVRAQRAVHAPQDTRAGGQLPKRLPASASRTLSCPRQASPRSAPATANPHPNGRVP